MKTTICLLVILAVFQITPNAADPQDLSEVYTFAANFDAAFEQAKAEKKPVMMLVQMTGCPACKALRPKLYNSAVVKDLSKSFVLINDLDHEDYKASSFKIPGENTGYHPRTIFFGWDGVVFRDIKNVNQAKYPYYFTTDTQFAAAMRKAIAANNQIQG